MRNTYGKLMFILQDSQSPAVKQQNNLNLVKEILTVELFLIEKSCTLLLSDPLLHTATKSIDFTGDKVSRDQMIEAKNTAVKTLCETYANGNISNYI